MMCLSSATKISCGRNLSASGVSACNTACTSTGGEPHECERIIRYMRRVAHGIEGDIRLFPMEETVWDSQIVISEVMANTQRVASLKEFVIVWD